MLASYGSEFLTFNESLTDIIDEDEAWAIKADNVSVSETDTENDSIFDRDAENVDTDAESPASSHSPSHSRTATSERTGTSRSSIRARRASIPLGAISFIKLHTSGASRPAGSENINRLSNRELIANLHRTASHLSIYEADAIAQEITRRDLELFLKIKVCRN